jgi:hypothetical protein
LDHVVLRFHVRSGVVVELDARDGKPVRSVVGDFFDADLWITWINRRTVNDGLREINDSGERQGHERLLG